VSREAGEKCKVSARKGCWWCRGCQPPNDRRGDDDRGSHGILFPWQEGQDGVIIAVAVILGHRFFGSASNGTIDINRLGYKRWAIVVGMSKEFGSVPSVAIGISKWRNAPAGLLDLYVAFRLVAIGI
jgi:hypothetical protein